MATMIRERALILCYTYIVCLNIYFTWSLVPVVDIETEVV